MNRVSVWLVKFRLCLVCSVVKLFSLNIISVSGLLKCCVIEISLIECWLNVVLLMRLVRLLVCVRLVSLVLIWLC